ncbi:Hypothetical predicted protein, partial [Marmota monax]
PQDPRLERPPPPSSSWHCLPPTRWPPRWWIWRRPCSSWAPRGPWGGRQDGGGRDKGRGGPKHKSSGKKNQPVKYSQLVVETSAGLASRSLSLVGIYAEARKVEGFNQQNSCTYLKYLVHAGAEGLATAGQGHRRHRLLQAQLPKADGQLTVHKPKKQAAPLTHQGCHSQQARTPEGRCHRGQGQQQQQQGQEGSGWEQDVEEGRQAQCPQGAQGLQ